MTLFQYWHHRIMASWHNWRIRRIVVKLRRKSRRQGLSFLDEYTDREIAIRLCRIAKYRDN